LAGREGKKLVAREGRRVGRKGREEGQQGEGLAGREQRRVGREGRKDGREEGKVAT